MPKISGIQQISSKKTRIFLDLTHSASTSSKRAALIGVGAYWSKHGMHNPNKVESSTYKNGVVLLEHHHCATVHV